MSHTHPRHRSTRACASSPPPLSGQVTETSTRCGCLPSPRSSSGKRWSPASARATRRGTRPGLGVDRPRKYRRRQKAPAPAASETRLEDKFRSFWEQTAFTTASIREKAFLIVSEGIGIVAPQRSEFGRRLSDLGRRETPNRVERQRDQPVCTPTVLCLR